MLQSVQSYGEATRSVIRDGFQDALPEVLTWGKRISALAFHSIKLLPALACIKDAERDGRLQPGGIIADTSSGTWLYGMARVAAVRKYRCIGVTDHAVNGDFAEALRSLGAEIIIVDAPADSANVQTLRKQRLNEIVAATGAVALDQYDNLVAAQAYEAAAEIASAHLPRIDILVAPIGTGSSSRGMTEFLRRANPKLRTVVCDTFNSALFGLKVGPRRLRGIGNSLVPRNVHHQAIDEVHFVTADVAHEGTLRISEAGLGDYGPTSGAAFMVANTISRSQPDARILCIFPDKQYRYIDAISDYRVRRDVLLTRLPTTPIPITRLSDAVEGRVWVVYDWHRRSRQEVMSTQETTLVL